MEGAATFAPARPYRLRATDSSPYVQATDVLCLPLENQSQNLSFRAATKIQVPNMRDRWGARGILCAVMATGAVAASACAATAARALVVLPNGYSLEPDKKAQSEIARRDGRCILPGPIAAYAVSGKVVAGALGEPSASSRLYTNDLPFKGGPDTRYFVLDTLSGKLETNLDQVTWNQRLQELGIPAGLQIYAPLQW